MASLISERRKKKSKNAKNKVTRRERSMSKEKEERSRARPEKEKPEKSAAGSLRKRNPSREKVEMTIKTSPVTPAAAPLVGDSNIFNPETYTFNIDKIYNPEPDNHTPGQNAAFETIATHIVTTGAEGLVREYAENLAHYVPTGYFERTFFDANTELKKNRYKDVVCNDKTRVILRDGRPGDYIHANYVRGILPGYILTQGPLKESLNDFWRMIVQEQVLAICMLCEFMENGKSKCEQYLPELGASTIFGDIVVSCEENAKTDKHTQLKILNVVDNSNGKSMKVSHFKISTWPDKTVALSNLSILRTHRTLRRFPGNVVIHCSAGVGRTGTFAAIEIGIQLLLNGKMFKLYDLVKFLRHCRMTSVQVDTQYLMLAQSLLECGVVFKYIEDPKLVEAVETHKRQVAEYVEAHPPPAEKGKTVKPTEEGGVKLSAEKVSPNLPNPPKQPSATPARTVTPPRRMFDKIRTRASKTNVNQTSTMQSREQL